jgi:hypothetical protein
MQCNKIREQRVILQRTASYLGGIELKLVRDTVKQALRCAALLDWRAGLALCVLGSAVYDIGRVFSVW